MMFLLDCTGFKERENKEKKLADKYILPWRVKE